jgi:hypothetical protein
LSDKIVPKVLKLSVTKGTDMQTPLKKITARGKAVNTPDPCSPTHSCHNPNTQACTHNLYCDGGNAQGGNCGAKDVYACDGTLGKKGMNIDLDDLILKAMKAEARKRARR